MTADQAEVALNAFRALRADVEQFDSHPPDGDSGHFSDKVPLFMKSYLVNWLRRFLAEHGDDVQALLDDASRHREAPPPQLRDTEIG
jgi:hypothetical protein